MLKLDKGKKYLLACSFGPDSMALFSMLLKEGFHFSAALVNYHLRKESSDEMNGFIEYCTANNITYHIKDLTEGVKGKNIEAECRKIRYQFFAYLSSQYQYDAVLVAHNQDDVIETYLMQKSRKNLVNHYGIKEQTYINSTLIIRPLLDVPKADLLNYCQSNSVPYSIDSSNYDVSFLRNKYRHEVISKMSKDDKDNIIKEINSINEQIDQIKEKLNLLNLNEINTLVLLNDKEFTIALNILIKRLNETLFISYRQVKEIKKVILTSNGNVDVPIRNNIVLRKSYSSIEFCRLEETGYSYQINKPMVFDCSYFYLNFTGDTSNRNVTLNDYPLTIRTYNSGDSYIIKNYSVSVRRLFIDWKMPKSLRERWPIIVNKDGKIIYIPRYRSDFVAPENINFYVK